ncbi:MAG: hypothetical protein JRH19_27045 [Deltaproteobacteria bacterium]|nr:hypothetical protein [Deltaproteobacteria bacterium]
MSESAFAERYGPWAVIAGGSDGMGAAQGLEQVPVAVEEEGPAGAG